MKKNSAVGLITKIKLKDFVQPNTPDSILNIYKDYYSMNYELGYEGNIVLILYDYLNEQKVKNYLTGNFIEFVWNGSRFIKSKPKFYY